MRKKGFTLIELLAVIVILAVIALIVTPIVTGIIKSAKEQANARSVEGHVKNIENAIILNAFARAGDMRAYDNKTKTEIEAIVTAENDPVTCASYTILNGTVQGASGCSATGWNKTYTYTIGNGAVAEVQVEFNGTYVAAQSGDTHKGIVYLDPSDLSATCNSNSEITTTNTGCKKFYIFDDSGSNYKMIMDRNTTASVGWAILNDYIEAGGTEEDWDEYKNDTYGPVTAIKRLRIDTANWIGSPRLIRDGEVRTITGNNDDWEYWFSGEDLDYHWLFDYTNGCIDDGCEIETDDTSFSPAPMTDGYWTYDTYDEGDAYYISSSGGLDRYSIYYSEDAHIGVRPVIEISKSLIGN